MKPILIRVLVALIFVAFPAHLAGAATADNHSASDRASVFRDRLENIAKELELTDEQREKLQPILQAEVERLRNLRADTSLSRRAKLRKLKEIRGDITQKVKEILTPEQFKKWEAIRAEARSEIRAARRSSRP